MKHFTGVLSSHIDLVWDQAKELLKPAIENKEQTLNEIYEDLKVANRQLWIVYENSALTMAAVTSIHDDKNGVKFCAWKYIGGTELRQVWHYSKVAFEWAKANGCKYVYTHCRPGLKRLFYKDWEVTNKTEHGYELVRAL